MNKLLIEPHYLGSLEYFAQITRFDTLELEVSRHFTKQTYKNRCCILTSQGKQVLSVPVVFTNRTSIKEVKIDNSQSWRRDHWGAVYSAYGKAPFFEYFADYFNAIWGKEFEFLIDLNMEFLTLCLKLLQVDVKIEFTEKFETTPQKAVTDLREAIQPKNKQADRKLYHPYAYSQNFGSEFVSNLSILDLLFSEGMASLEVLKRSVPDHNEQIG